MAKIVLVTGASRGIGFATAIALAQRGHFVFASMRTPLQASPFPDALADLIQLIEMDVTDSVSIHEAITSITKEKGRLDVVINNAGYGLFGPIEMVSIEEAQEQFDVNFFGVMRVIHATVPLMRRQKSGQIINVSSIAGIVSSPNFGIYCATKHALEALSASLAVTLEPWNIFVSVIEPGPVATGFADSLQVAKGDHLKDNPYHLFVEEHKKRVAEMLKDGQPPEEVAEVIANVVAAETPHFRYQTSPRLQGLAAQFIVDTTGDRWLEEQREKIGESLRRSISTKNC